MVVNAPIWLDVRVAFDVDEAGGPDVTAGICVDVRVVSPEVNAGTIDVTWVDVIAGGDDVSAGIMLDVIAGGAVVSAGIGVVINAVICDEVSPPI